jgi:anti-anti-sigma factor
MEVKMIELKVEGKTARIKILKDLIEPNIKGLVEEVKSKINEYHFCEEVIIDISGVKSIDSTGITLLIGIYKSMKAKGIITKLEGVSKEIYELFKYMSFEEVFEISVN